MKHIGDVGIAAFSLIFAIVSFDTALAASKLEKIFKFDMLNVEAAYLEQITGPARQVYEGRSKVEVRIYRVDGCDVSVDFEKNAAQRYALSLSPKCSFNLGAFVPGYGSTRGLTLRKFVGGPQRPDVRFHADCVSSYCGNAADPTVDFIWDGPHSANFLHVVLSATVAGDAALAAALALDELMLKNEGEDYLSNTKFNCDGKYDQVAARRFADVPIDRIEVGFASSDAKCPNRQ